MPAEAYKTSTPASTIKDVLDYVPGVFAQPKWGDDTRLSIRGSGLSRNFHLRSIQLYQDGVPLNTADGHGDFQEIDPSAYRYVEVYKGANALRYGANSLGGAINFVTTTGHDASIAQGALDFGSFGFRRGQASSGMRSTPSSRRRGRSRTASASIATAKSFQGSANADTHRSWWRAASRLRHRLDADHALGDLFLPWPKAVRGGDDGHLERRNAARRAFRRILLSVFLSDALAPGRIRAFFPCGRPASRAGQHGTSAPRKATIPVTSSIRRRA